MSCKHGNWQPCDECAEEDAAWQSAYKSGYEEGGKISVDLTMKHLRRAELAEAQLAALQAKHDALVKRLREPTQEMQTAGVDATEFTFSCKRQVRDAFRAMSAVALDKGG